MQSGTVRISSREFAEITGFTASQIRQDLNCFGGFGQQGYGYNVASLRAEIGNILALDKRMPAILIGAGNLGVALINHINFEHCGFRLVGIFDINPAIIGSKVNRWLVWDVAFLPDFCKEYRPAIAVLCTPPASVTELAKTLVELNVKNFWNFSQHDLSFLRSEDIAVEDVQLSDSLMTLSFQANEKIGEYE